MTRNAYDIGDDGVVSINDLSRFLDALPAPFVVYGPDERIVASNNAYKREYHPYEDQVKTGVTHTELQWLKVNKGLVGEAVARGAAFVQDEQQRHRYGPEVEEWQDEHGKFIRLLRVRLSDGHVIGMRFDITDLRQAQIELEERNGSLKQAQRELETVAMIDELTGLANRRAATSVLDQLADRCRITGEKLTLILFDLDQFKQINDSFGHAAGDTLLQTFAERMTKAFHDCPLIARMGGDEFLVARTGHEGEAVLTVTFENALGDIAQPITFGDVLLDFGVSAGMATEDAESKGTSLLLAMADRALYTAKRVRGNALRPFDKILKKKARTEAQLRQDVLSGAMEQQLVLHFQPIVEAADIKRVPAAEALVRWNHPRFGLLSPLAFFPVVEELKAMERLDELVLDAVLAQTREWSEQGIQFPKISVNVSPQRLLDASLPSRLAARDIPADKICFEILETVSADNANDVLQWNLDYLHSAGFELQIDDYGSSHSSISSLTTIRPKRIKIDRRFCGQVVASEEATEIVRLTVALANALGMTVIAEGVEDPETAEHLASLGCDRLQGYLFGKPCAADDFVTLLKHATITDVA